MSLKTIRKQLKDANIKASVRYLGNEMKAQGININRYLPMTLYEITFPKIEGEEYWDEPEEVINDSDACRAINEYLEDLKNIKQS